MTVIDRYTGRVYDNLSDMLPYPSPRLCTNRLKPWISKRVTQWNHVTTISAHYVVWMKGPLITTMG